MPRDPKSRAELHRRLTELLGADNADTLMEALPPHSWDELMTKADLAAAVNELAARIDARFDGVERRLDRNDARFDQVEGRLDRVDTRFDQVEGRLDRVDTRFDQVEGRLDQVGTRFDRVDTRFDQVDARFDQLDPRFDQVDARLEHRDEVWSTRLDAMEHKLTAVFRGELNAALTSQTRAILVSNVTLFVAGGSFVLAAARLL